MTEWEPGWPALAEAVRQRRARLGLNQEDIPTRGGPSSSTVRKIEGAAAGNYQARILFQLDEALAWGKGTSQEIVEGPREWMGAFSDFMEHVVKDTRAAERRGDDYPVGWQVETRGGPGADITGPGGTQYIEVKHYQRFAGVSDEELVAELAARLTRRGNAQAPEPEQGAGGPQGSGEDGEPGGRGTPIAPRREPEPESMDKLREMLDGGKRSVTRRSQEGPKSGRTG